MNGVPESSWLYCPPERPALHVTVDKITTSIQLCLSPHCTALASLIEGAPTSGWPRPSGSGWRDAVAARGGHLDFGPLAPYTCGLPLAPFLCAVLREPAPRFRDQVREIEETDRQVIGDWLCKSFGDEVPAAYQSFRSDVDTALQTMSRSLERYFDAVIAPLWPSIRGFLDRELIRIGYLLATQPAAVVLNAVHPSMHIDGDTLIVESPQGPLSGTLAGRKLKLTPLIACGNAILVDFNGIDEIKVGYAAPGVEELWAGSHEQGRDDTGDIGKLLGQTRAAVLRALDAPDSTTTLARRLALSASTTSEHLSALATLGLIAPIRVGRRVYYRRTPRGDRLLGLFCEPLTSLA